MFIIICSSKGRSGLLSGEENASFITNFWMEPLLVIAARGGPMSMELQSSARGSLSFIRESSQLAFIKNMMVRYNNSFIFAEC
jgi:hypothetical protein